MASDRTIKVAFVGDTARLRSALKSVEDSSSRVGRTLERTAGQASSLGSRITSAMRTAAFAVGGAATAIGASLAHAFAEAREAEKIGKITEQLIVSTGGAAKVTAAQVSQLAESLSAKTAIDDEAIQSSANLLLTFTRLRNEAGAGNNVFDRAVELAQDMATVMGTDAQSAAMQLGKALNDPLRGLTALGRAGIQFSAQQREQIEQFVEAGDILSAQKIILEEVGTQFGGAAAAAATPTARLRVILGNVAEDIGAMLLPVADRAATWLGEVLPVAVERLRPVLAAIGDVISQHVVPWLATVVDTVRENWPEIRATAEEVFAKVAAAITSAIGVIRSVGRFVLEHKDAFLTAAAAVSGFVVAFRTINSVISVIKTLQTSFAALNAIMAANPIVLVVAALAALVAAVVIAYKRFEPFRELVDTVGRALRDGFGAALEWITTTVLPPLQSAISTFVGIVTALWQKFGDNILGFVRGTWDNIRAVISGVLTIIQGIINTVLGVLTGDWSRAWDGIRGIVSGVWTAIGGIVSQAWNAITTMLSIGLEAARGLFTRAWDGIRSLTGKAIDGIVGFFRDLPGRILGLAAAIGNAALDIGSTIIRKIIEGISGFVGFVADVGKAIINAAIGFVNSQIIDRINDALEIKISGPGPLPDINLNPPDIPHIPRLAEGGIVTRPTVALVGEAGPEAVVPLSGRHAMVTMYVTVNMPPGSDGEDVVDALRRYQRRNGPIPIRVA